MSHSSSVRRKLLTAIAGVPMLLMMIACEGDGPRVYTAQPYDPAASCLGSYEPIGLVTAGDLPGTCEPVCLRRDDVLFLSTVCPPYPDTTEREFPEASEECALALGSLGAEAYCE